MICFITRIAVHKRDDASQFERELQETRPMRPQTFEEMFPHGIPATARSVMCDIEPRVEYLNIAAALRRFPVSRRSLYLWMREGLVRWHLRNGSRQIHSLDLAGRVELKYRRWAA